MRDVVPGTQKCPAPKRLGTGLAPETGDARRRWEMGLGEPMPRGFLGVAAPVLYRSDPISVALPGREIELGVAQQSIDQPHQLPGGERHGPLVMISGGLVVLGLVIGSERAEVAPLFQPA